MYIRPATSATYPRSGRCGYPGVAEDNASFAFHVSKFPSMYKPGMGENWPHGNGGCFFPSTYYYYYDYDYYYLLAN